MAGQLAISLIVVLSVGLICGVYFGYSALVGAGIGILPTYYLALRMFRRTGPLTPEKALRGIYVGEAIKVAFTVALFALAVLLLNVHFVTVVATYLATVMVNWVAVLKVDLGESPRV